MENADSVGFSTEFTAARLYASPAGHLAVPGLVQCTGTATSGLARGKTIERMQPKSPTRKAAPGGQIPRHHIYSDGRRTSISLENEFWDAFLEIAAARRMSPGELLSVAVTEAPNVNRSSAVRIFVLMHFRRLAADRSGVIG